MRGGEVGSQACEEEGLLDAVQREEYDKQAGWCGSAMR